MSNELILQQHLITSVNGCAFTLHEVSHEDEILYNVVAHLMIDADNEGGDDFELPLIMEIYHPTMSGALFMAYRSTMMFTENFYDDVPVFDEEGEMTVELSLDEIMTAIREEIEASREEVPEGTTVH